MEVQVSASGSIQHSTVDKMVVDGLVHATDNFMVYLGLANFSAGIMVAAALTLAAEVKHPIVVYLALTAGVSLTVAMLLVLFREGSRVQQLRSAMRSSTAGINWTITPAIGEPTLLGSAGTSTSGSLGSPHPASSTPEGTQVEPPRGKS
jgi:hypothetical protein